MKTTCKHMGNSSQLTKVMSFRVPMDYYFEAKKEAVNRGFTLSDEIMERLFTYGKHLENGISIESYEALKAENESLKSQVDIKTYEAQTYKEEYESVMKEYQSYLDKEVLKAKIKKDSAEARKHMSDLKNDE